MNSEMTERSGMTAPETLEMIGEIRRTRFFYAAAAVMLLLLLGTNPLWGSEDRWAEISREMLLTGDWWHPAINFEVYFDKPLLSYWLICWCSRLTGCFNEFIVRLPMALSALAALWGIRDLGARLFDRKTGELAGWLMLSSYAFLFWGRTAAAELPNLTAILLAVDWFLARENRPGFVTYAVFALICFAGALTKGLPALIIPPMLVLIALLLKKRLTVHLNRYLLPAVLPGLLLYFGIFCLAAILPMPAEYRLPAGGLSGLGLVWRENVLRVFQPFDHNKEPFFCYLYHVPRLMLPWTHLVMAAFIAQIRNWKQENFSVRFLLLASAAITLLFSASGSRRWYYILPIVPFLALTTAAWLRGQPADKWLLKLHRLIFFILGIAVGAGALALLIVRHFYPHALLIFVYGRVWLAAAAGGILTACLLRRRCGNLRMLIAGAVAVGTVFTVIQPLMGARRTEKSFALALRRQLPGVKPEQLIFLPECSGKMAYYLNLRKPAVSAGTPAAAAKMLPRGEAYLILLDKRGRRRQAAEVFPEVNGAPLLEEKLLPTEKPKAAKWRVWKVTKK